MGAIKADQEAERRLLRTDEMFVEGNSYRRLKAKYQAEAARARAALDETGEGHAEVVGRAAAAVDILKALPRMWARAEETGDAEAQSDITGSIFAEKVVFEEGSFRTRGSPPHWPSLRRTGRKSETPAQKMGQRLLRYPERDRCSNPRLSQPSRGWPCS
jgi:hypothetical protein